MRSPALILACLLLATAASATLPGNWLPGHHVAGTDDPVLCSTVWNGDLVIGGSFGAVGDAVAHRAARWDGNQWSGLGGLPASVTSVVDLHVHDGQLIAFARLSSSGNAVFGHDQNQWYQIGDSFAGTSQGLATYDGALHAGAHRLEGGQWTDVLQPNGFIRDLDVHDGRLVACGNFTTLASVSAVRVGAWDGAQVLDLYPGQDTFMAVELEVWQDDLYIGRWSDFDTVPAVQRWTGEAWLDVPELGNVNLARKLGDLAATEDALLSCGYWYPIIVASPRSMWGAFLNRWDGAGGSVVYEVEEPARLYTVALAGGRVLAGGSFSQIGMPRCVNLGWIDTGAMSPVSDAGAGATGEVRHLETYATSLAVAGSFAVIGDIESSGAALLAGGQWESRDLAQANEPYVAESVAGMAWHQGFLHAVARGHYNTNAGRWYLDQWIWGDDFNVPEPVDVVSHDGRLLGLASGDILDYTDHENPPIWMTIDGRGIAFGDAGGLLAVGGEFDAIDGTPATNIAVLAGDVVLPLGAGLPEPVRAVGSWQGQVVAARWGDGNDPAISVIERFDGSNWVPIGQTDGLVDAIAEYSGQLVVGGLFTTVDDVPTGALAVWNGSDWSALGPIHGRVRALAESWGSLWVGGDFGAAGTVASSHIAVFYTSPTDVDDRPPLVALALSAPFPNPFNPRTTISFTLPAGGSVRLDAYDARGRHVGRVLDEGRPAGEHTVVWTGLDDTSRPLPSGTYILRLRAGGQEQAVKAVLVR